MALPCVGTKPEHPGHLPGLAPSPHAPDTALGWHQVVVVLIVVEVVVVVLVVILAGVIALVVVVVVAGPPAPGTDFGWHQAHTPRTLPCVGNRSWY